MDLALVSSDMEARRFQLWEATPIEYLERLLLQNELVPGLNRLEGVIDQGDDLAIVTSQPRFDIVPVTLAGGFLQFIADTLAAGHTVAAVRTVSTSR